MGTNNFIKKALVLSKLDVDKKISKYSLQQDRADVIDFALQYIY